MGEGSYMDLRSRRALSWGRAVSLLARFALLRGLTCHANPQGVTAFHSNPSTLLKIGRKEHIDFSSFKRR